MGNRLVKKQHKVKLNKQLSSRAFKESIIKKSSTQPDKEDSRLKIRMSDFFIKNKNSIGQEYKFLNPPLGKGAYGEVRKALHKTTNTYRAVKIINKNKLDKEDRKHVVKEAELLKTLDHPHIVKVFETFETENLFYIVMEYLEGKHLFDALTQDDFKYSERSIAKIMNQLLSAITFMHKNGIMHRDIKSENIICMGENIVLIDFGNSKKIEVNKKNKECTGTTFYIAPEVLKGRHNEKCDVWSAGVLLWVLLTGKPPFKGANEEALDENILNLKYAFDIDKFPNISDGALDLLKKMMEPDYKKRASASQIMKHKWLRKQKKSIKQRSYREVLERIENYQYQSKLQEALYLYFVNTLVDKKEAEDLIQLFTEMDENGDGILSKEEIKNGLEKTGKVLTDSELDKLFDELDLDGNGSISFGEFLAASIDKEEVLSHERISSMFKHMDRSGNGRISIDELHYIFQNHKSIKPSNWDHLTKQLKLNRDNTMNFEEFKKLMLKIVKNDRKRSMRIN